MDSKLNLRGLSASCCLIAFIAVSSGAPAQTPMVLEPGLAYGGPIVDSTTLLAPGLYGGVAFDATGSTFYLGAAADGALGTVWSFPVQRDPTTQRITGFAAGAPFCAAPDVDGGLAFGPAGTLFYCGWPSNTLGQFNGTSTLQFSFPINMPASVGGLAFVPGSLPNAGKLLVSIYGGGQIWEVTLTAVGGGFYQPIAATLWADFGVGIGMEGLAFIPSGPYAGSLLVCTWGELWITEIDPSTGLPLGGTFAPAKRTLGSNPQGMGVAFDPIRTGEVFVSDWGQTQVHHFVGLDSLQPLSIESPVHYASLRTPFALDLSIRAGTANAGRVYLLGASATGTLPGTPIGPVTLPLNIDALTYFVFQYSNTPLFSNFFSVTGPDGSATATINVPPGYVPPGTLVVDWAYFLFTPVDFASNAAQTILYP